MSAPTQLARDLWITRPVPRPDARLRLFCFPHAGGGVAQYRAWVDLLPSSVELLPVRLPGRETRHHEPALRCLADVVEGAVDALASMLDRPAALFGHSMGALVAFEVAHRLRDVGAPHPVHLFVSGRRAPHLSEPGRTIHDLPDADLLDELASRYGPSAIALLRDPELRPVFLPLLRADLQAVEIHSYVPRPPLECPITAFGGTLDARASAAELESWREHTTAAFQVRRFEGDHFFVQPARRELVAEISRALKPALPRPAVQ